MKAGDKAKLIRMFKPWPEILIPRLGIIFASRPPTDQILLFSSSICQEVFRRFQDQRWQHLQSQEDLLQACLPWVADKQRIWFRLGNMSLFGVGRCHVAWQLQFESLGSGRFYIEPDGPCFHFFWRKRVRGAVWTGPKREYITPPYLRLAQRYE